MFMVSMVPRRRYGTEKTTTKEGKTEYMRIYMRDHRAEKKQQDEAKQKQIKLNLIETLLEMQYVTIKPQPDELLAKPDVKLVPQIGLRRNDSFTVKVDGKDVPMYDPKPLDVSTAKVIEGVPKHLVEIVYRLQEYCFAKGFRVSRIRVKRDIEFYMSWSVSDLIAKQNALREIYLGEQFRSLIDSGLKTTNPKVMVKVAEWRKFVKERREIDDDFDKFVIVSILADHSNEEILFGAKADEKASNFFRYHIEDYAKIHIQELRNILRPEKESRGDKIIGPITREERDYAVKALNVEAAARTHVAAKRLVDARRKGLPTKSKKKKPVYHVTVDE